MERIVQFIIKYLFAVASFLYLFTFGLFLEKHRSLLVKICQHFGYDPDGLAFKLPPIGYSEIIPELLEIKLIELDGGSGGVSHKELIIISAFIRFYEPKNVFEIGTFNGRTTLNMAANSLEDAIVYTLDLPKEALKATVHKIERGDRNLINKKKYGAKIDRLAYKNKIVQLYGDSASFDYKSFYSAIDFVFIDGSHAYDYVVNDTKHALKMLRNGKGIILWHDYNAWKGVNRALNEFYENGGEPFKNMQHIHGTSLVVLLVN
ncbi:MAG: class I SAM-dependent methyltransferase [Candidatus Omnitrophica bacterium]|nr:class I SAM-dependent methyltransferase [Candidatus Omnitrophota bacterium]